MPDKKKMNRKSSDKHRSTPLPGNTQPNPENKYMPLPDHTQQSMINTLFPIRQKSWRGSIQIKIGLCLFQVRINQN